LLSADPDFCAFGAFRGIEKVGMEEARGAFPIAVTGFVRSRDIDGIRPVILPNRCCGKAKFDFMGWEI
jgi:hypothetical protein